MLISTCVWLVPCSKYRAYPKWPKHESLGDSNESKRGPSSTQNLPVLGGSHAGVQVLKDEVSEPPGRERHGLSGTWFCMCGRVPLSFWGLPPEVATFYCEGIAESLFAGGKAPRVTGRTEESAGRQ